MLVLKHILFIYIFINNAIIIFKVQIQAVKAICAFILHHEKVLEIQKQFTDLLPNMLRVSYC